MSKIYYNINLFKITSYISSLFLTSIYVFFRLNGTHHSISIIQLVVVVLSSLYVVYYLFVASKDGKLNNIEDVEIIEVKQEKFITSNYLFSNILPVIALDFSATPDTSKYARLLCLAFVIVLGFIYIRNDLFYINPLYDFLQINTYTAKIYVKNKTDTKETMIISKCKLYNSGNPQCVKAIIKNNIVIVNSTKWSR